MDNLSGRVAVVTGAAGGIGLILCQWASALGATVIGAVSTPDKAVLARANGCAHTIVYSEGDFVQRAIELNGGRRIDAVYDAVGKDTFVRSLGALRPAGQIITFGRASGPIPPIDVATMLNRDALTVSAGTLFAFTEGLGRLQLMGREWFEALLEAEDVDILGWALGTIAVPAEMAGPLMERMQRLDYVEIPR